MVRTSALLVAILLVFAVSHRNCFGFKWPFLGNVTDEKLERRALCYTKICLKDADILIKAATLNDSVDPCMDFKSFALGEFHEYRHLNDRYTDIGFENDIYRNLYEKKRVVLKLKHRDHEPRVFTIMKQFFAKCRNSTYIRATVGDDLLAILQRYDMLSHASNGSWLGKGSDTKILFDFESDLMFQEFLHHKLDLCDDPRNSSKKLICFYGVDIENYENFLPTLMDRLKLSKNRKQKILENYASYFSKVKKIEDDDSTGVRSDELYKIKDLTSRFPSENINWLKIINDNLFHKSQVTEDEEIMITHPAWMKEVLLLLSESESQTITDTFSAIFIYRNQKTFNIYKHAPWDIANRGTTRSYQRFEECIDFIEKCMNPALLSLTATKYSNKLIQETAKEFTAETVTDYIGEIKSYEGIEDEVKQKIVEQLSTINYEIAFPEDVLNETVIAEFYDELELDGTESFLTTWMRMETFGVKMRLERDSNPFVIFNDVEVIYDFARNTLSIPLLYTIYPSFHPNRPRYFNMATLHCTIAGVIDVEMTNFVNKEMREETNETFDELLINYELSYRSYDKWLLDGGKEIRLPGFKLTDRQMFWLTNANVWGFKHHKFSKGLAGNAVIYQKYYHVSYKIDPDFRKDFNCEDLTVSERKLYEEFEEKMREYYESEQES